MCSGYILASSKRKGGPVVRTRRCCWLLKLSDLYSCQTAPAGTVESTTQCTHIPVSVGDLDLTVDLNMVSHLEPGLATVFGGVWPTIPWHSDNSFQEYLIAWQMTIYQLPVGASPKYLTPNPNILYNLVNLKLILETKKFSWTYTSPYPNLNW